MKKLLIILLSFCFLVFPFNIEAKEIESLNLKEALESEGINPSFEEYKEDDNQAIIYMFRGDGETKSVEFLKYLDSIYKEYGQFFKLKSYEVGSNPKNSKLMDNVLDYLKAEVSSVPFIVIGDVHFLTYDETVSENVLNTIISTYQSENKTDVIEEVLVRYYRNYDLMIWVIILFLIIFIGSMIYASRKGNKNSD